MPSARASPATGSAGLVEAGSANFYGYNATNLFTNRGSGPAASSDDQELICLKSTASGVVWRQNGVTTATSSTLASGPVSSSLSLWGFVDNPAWPYWGDDYETLWYDRVLTDAEIAQVEGYLLGHAPVYDPGTTLPLLMFAGNSLMAGVGTSLNAHEMPNVVEATLGSGYHRLNAGVGGTTTAVWASTYKASRIDPYYSASRPKNLAIFWELSNDIAQASLDGPTAFAGYTAFLRSLVTAGWTVIALDCLPRTIIAGSGETARTTANSDLAADFTGATANPRVFRPAGGITYASALVKVSQITNLSDSTNTTYYADGTHLTDTGYALVAADVAAAVAMF
jgi:lysophospholipase L1-like esterase